MNCCWGGAGPGELTLRFLAGKLLAKRRRPGLLDAGSLFEQLAQRFKSRLFERKLRAELLLEELRYLADAVLGAIVKL